jgi:hypothetical protein
VSFQIPPPGYRSYSGSGAIIQVDVAGNDTTGNGSVGFPFLTLDRALRESNVSGATAIALGAGTFDCPASIDGGGTPTITGTLTDSAVTGVVDAVVTTSGAGAFTLDVTLSTGAAVANAYRATLYRFTSGAANGRYFWIAENDATAGTTRVYGVQDVAVLGSAPIAPTIGNTFVRVDFATTIQTVLNNSPTFNTQVSFANCQVTSVTSTSSITVNGRTNFTRCLIQVGQRLQTATTIEKNGKITLNGCYYQPRNTNTTVGALTLAGGVVRWSRGNVLDFSLCAVSGRFFRAIGDSAVSSSDAVVLSTVEGIRLGASSWSITGQQYQVRDGWSFLSSSSGAWFCNAGSTRPDYGGDYALPPSYGAISGDHAVEAANGAKVVFPLPGSLTSALGVNVVSTDGGTTTRAVSNDGTTIIGMSPVRERAFGAYDVGLTSGPSTLAVQPWSLTLCNPTAGNIDINFPATPAPGDQIAVVNNTAIVLNTITVNGNGNNIASSAVPGTFVASEVFAVAGLRLVYFFTGTIWVLS